MNDVFNQASTQTPTPASQGGDELTTKLASIVNEKGEQKYADINTALDALKASQEFIPNLKEQVTAQTAEISALREQVSKIDSVEAALAKFTAPQQQQEAQPEPQPSNPPVQFGQADIESLVHNVFNSHVQQTQAEANVKQVNDALFSKFGDKASAHLTAKAAELNTTPQALEDMAKTNPTMALTLLGATAKSAAPTPSYGGTNTTTFGNQAPERLGKPTSSMMVGANKDDLMSFMSKIRDEVYADNGITN